MRLRPFRMLLIIRFVRELRSLAMEDYEANIGLPFGGGRWVFLVDPGSSRKVGLQLWSRPTDGNQP